MGGVGSKSCPPCEPCEGGIRLANNAEDVQPGNLSFYDEGEEQQLAQGGGRRIRARQSRRSKQARKTRRNRRHR